MPIEVESWTPAPGYPKYEVSTLGRVRNAKTKRVLKPNPVSDRGYLQVTLMRAGRRSVLVSRLVCEAFHGSPRRGMEAAHRDGNTKNNRPSNLRWLTSKQNEHDKRNHGTYPEGERNGRAKLVRQQVLEIRALWDAGFSRKEIASRYGITPNQASNIGKRKSWSHI